MILLNTSPEDKRKLYSSAFMWQLKFPDDLKILHTNIYNAKHLILYKFYTVIDTQQYKIYKVF